MRNFTILPILILLGALLAGCGMPSVRHAQRGVVSAQAVLCDSVKNYAASLTALTQVDASTTVGQFQTLRQASADARATMVKNWGYLQKAEFQAVQAAADQFQDTLKQIKPQDTLGEAAAKIKANAAAVKAAVDQLDQKACPAAK